MILSHRSRRVSNLRKKSPDGHCLTGAFLYWNQWAGLFGHKGIESLGFRGHLTLDFPTFKDVISSDQLVLVDFFATWCQPCKMMHPILEQVKEVLGDRIRIIKVDVDKYGVTASQYGIQSVPTLMLFRRGEVLWRTSGVMQKSELLATIDPFLR